MRLDRKSSRQRAGVALIEALVALAVMAFGLLAVAGVQATLRQNADTARQRGEAVRIGQQEIERLRAFVSLTGGAGTPTYSNIQLGSAVVAADADTQATRNTQYTLTRSVDESVAQGYKALRVRVSWSDRNNEAQAITLSTAVAGVAPALAGTVSVPANGVPTALPGGRNGAIPLGAVPVDSLRSAFRPPQAADGTVVWVFNNLTGIITTCSLDPATALTRANIDAAACDGRAQLLSGYINFADPTVLATTVQALTPTGPALALQVQVNRTLPSALLVGQGNGCFTAPPVVGISTLAYYCAVPVSTGVSDPRVWSGYSAAGLPSASGLAVCRYTRYRSDTAVSTTPPVMTNADHPRLYSAVNGPLSNQNFLVVRAVSGTSSDCPDGLPGGTTTYPQPATAP